MNMRDTLVYLGVAYQMPERSYSHQAVTVILWLKYLAWALPQDSTERTSANINRMVPVADSLNHA